jgi:hypothetical protein
VTSPKLIEPVQIARAMRATFPGLRRAKPVGSGFMAILHAATLTPSKAEIISGWLDAAVDLVGAYRFDDPEGRVGIEGHLVQSGGALLHVPLTYRDAPLAGADAHLVGTMQHSALGERWVYAGVGDPVFTRMLAAVTMTGCGQSVGMVEFDGRWLVVPTAVRLAGGGWGKERVAVDGMVLDAEGGDGWAVLRNDRLELRVARRPAVGSAPIGLNATWPGQDDAVLLAEVRPL